MHKWKLYDDGRGAFCVTHHERACMMDRDEIERRLGAMECLSAKDAKFAYRNLIPTDSHAPNVDYSLRAYAKALEGDEEVGRE